MRGSRLLNTWCRAFLSLILLVANVFAPFRTSSFGRAFLESLPQNVANHPLIRVRALTTVATSVGHRAVVGLARRGQDGARSGTRSNAFSAFLPAPTDTLPCPRSARQGMRLTPPLRC